MFYRCGECEELNFVKAGSLAISSRLECESCRHGFDLVDPRRLGKSDADHYGKARELAEAAQIDVPSAYSVLLGILPMSRARGIQNGDARPPEQHRSEATTPRPSLFESPPSGAPQPVVDKESERRRQRRKARALSIVERYGLPVELAFRVIDRRISLMAALAESSGERAAGDRSWGVAFREYLVAGLALLLVTVAGAHVARPGGQATAQDDSNARAKIREILRAVEIRKDESGQVLAVAGPDPRHVLIAYCEAVSAQVGCEPLEIASTVPARPGVKLGIVHDGREEGSRYAIQIRRESGTRWVAGSQSGPLVLSIAPALPAGTAKIPITLWK